MWYLPCFSISSRFSLWKSRGGSDSPARPLVEGLPLSTLVRSGSGKPPGGWPMRPSKYSTTDDGKLSSSAFSSRLSSSRLFCTMNCARSPTTFELGVTLTMSPSSLD